MIGQNLIKQQVLNLDKNSLPKVISIIGRCGFGKSTVADFIISYLGISEVIKINSIDDIRNIIKYAPNLSHNTALHIESFEKLNFRAKEILLKICEDIPNFIYIIIEVTNSELFFDRFMNRSFILTLEPYTKSEINEIIHSFGDITDDSVELLKSFLGSPKDFKLCYEYGNIFEVKSFIDTVYNNVLAAEPYNSMKIINKLKTKKDSDGIDFNLFFNGLYNIAFKNYFVSHNDNDLKLFMACQKVIDTLVLNPNINKKMLFDNFILSLGS